MAENGRHDASDTSSTGATCSDRVYVLADVLECEFRELHESGPERDTRRSPSPNEKPRQPLADPSLAPASYDSTKQADPQSRGPDDTEVSKADRLRTLWEKMHELPGDGRTALCLSGGGVRSAAFNLGVLQGLARLELLSRFHYLSTVSGGGYIGCWLSAWRARSRGGLSDICSGLSWPDRIGEAEVLPRVPDAISNLRCFTNYLNPTAGVLSPDSWASIIIIGRNLILNHIVIVPLVAALLVLAKVFGAVAHEHCVMDLWEWCTRHVDAALFGTSAAASYLGSFLIPGMFAALGWITLSIARPSWDGRRCSAPTPSQGGIAEIWPPRLGIGLVLVGAVLFGLIASRTIPQAPLQPAWSWSRFAAFPIGGSAGAFVAFLLAVLVAVFKRILCGTPTVAKDVIRFLGYVPQVPPGPATVPTAGLRAICLLAIAAALAGAAGGLVLGAGEEVAAQLPSGDPISTALVLSIAPFWFVVSYNAGDAVFLGLTARRPRARHSNWSDRWGDEEREWVARTAGWLTLIALGISIVLFLTLFGAYLVVIPRSEQWKGPLLVIVGVLSAIASIGLAASPFSTQFGTAAHGIRLPVRSILTVATPIFAGLLAGLLSGVIDLALFRRPLLELLQTRHGLGGFFDPTTSAGQGWLLMLSVCLAGFSCAAAFFVNINRFSLYDLYRMRLTREFLGASNTQRRPEVWTGFDEGDDIPLADADLLKKLAGEKRLYPVINAALNMAATKRLDWQERKAVSFVFTPHYSGSGATPDLGFRETRDYASGINLGWAMSVSGAAVSPNAGYSTMPGLALLMTLFNLRLGVWSGNPGAAGRESWQLRGPRFGVRPLLSEALARTNDQSKYVYLSDGGHFDNLGLYEMLRRRCRYILVSDATADPDYVYADLGSVMRKAAIDFGIRITFEHLDMINPGAAPVRGAHSAFAIIEYPEVQSNGDRQRGYLLYVKPYCGGKDEPADVRAYWHSNPAFPHDTTLDQFFGEAQFESYRALGSYTVMELGRRAGFAATSRRTKPNDLVNFFGCVRTALADFGSAEEA